MKMPGSLPWFSLHAALKVWLRNFTIYQRTYLTTILPNFFEPLIYLMGMGIGLGAYVRQINGLPYLTYIAPGLMASSAMMGASFETTYNVFVKLHFGKIYDAMLVTPLNVEDIVLGEMLWATTRSVIYGLSFYAVIALFGVPVWSSLLTVVPVIAATGALFAVFGLLFTALIPIIDLYSYYYTLFMTPMFLFSGIFFPLDTLPDWVATIAWFTPLYHAVNVARSSVLGTWTGGEVVDIAWIAVLTLLLLGFAAIFMRKRMIAGF
jgi:lipooligosaccharide transport system permease protein